MPGFKQKLAWSQAAAAATSSAGPAPPSALASLCLDKWAWGEMSIPMVQAICQAAITDGNNHPDVKELAKATTLVHLHDKIPENPFTNALTKTKLYMQVPGATTIEGSWQHMMLPHELFAAMYSYDKDLFVEKMCGGSVEEIGKFWEQMKGHPAYEGHPVHLRANFKERCIPLALHGDGVAVTGINKKWAKSCDAFSWKSVLSRGSTISCNYLIWLFFWLLSVKAGGMNTWDRFVKKLSWSFYWLFVGKFPDKDEFGTLYDKDSDDGKRAGKDLADGFYACLWLLLGDLEYLAKAWGLANPGCLTPCSLCKANKSTIPWTDCRDAATWRGTIWTATTWMEAGPARSHLFHKVPGLTIHAYVPDIMHTLHLGCYAYFIGSVLKHLVHHHMRGTIKNNCDRIWAVLKEAYQDQHP